LKPPFSVYVLGLLGSVADKLI